MNEQHSEVVRTDTSTLKGVSSGLQGTVPLITPESLPLNHFPCFSVSPIHLESIVYFKGLSFPSCFP